MFTMVLPLSFFLWSNWPSKWVNKTQDKEAVITAIDQVLYLSRVSSVLVQKFYTKAKQHPQAADQRLVWILMDVFEEQNKQLMKSESGGLLHQTDFIFEFSFDEDTCNQKENHKRNGLDYWI